MEYDLWAPSQEESGSRIVKQHRSVWKWGVELPFCSNSVGKCRETEVPKISKDDVQIYFPKFSDLISMGDLQDPIHGGTLVPYVWPYELWGYSLT